jgi:glutamate-5-semialdehyde dehydrogenase
MDLKEQLEQLGRRARKAARALSLLSTEQKNAGLLAIADELESHTDSITAANAKDVAKAKADGLAAPMVDRLVLNEQRIKSMADAVRHIAILRDPVGEIIRDWTPPSGIHITKVRVPIGVVCMIYESRPNVTSDCAALCLKTGNAVLLRGGSDALNSNAAIAQAVQSGCAKAGLPSDAILLVPGTDREAIRHLAEMDRYIDVIIPRGGEALIEVVVSHARMPVVKHSHGLCIVYVDKDADLAMAEEIMLNAKVQRPGVCNAAETLLVHRDVAASFLPQVGRKFAESKVELRVDDSAFPILSAENYPQLKRATDTDWRTEFLDLILAVRVVDSDSDAIEHIERYGSHHSDCIVTASESTAKNFLAAVDSATVYWNASTRFTDGAEFGFGAEVGISTGKVGVRGPMGLEELTTYKYIIRGDGQIR